MVDWIDSSFWQMECGHRACSLEEIGFVCHDSMDFPVAINTLYKSGMFQGQLLEILTCLLLWHSLALAAVVRLGIRLAGIHLQCSLESKTSSAIWRLPRSALSRESF